MARGRAATDVDRTVIVVFVLGLVVVAGVLLVSIVRGRDSRGASSAVRSWLDDVSHERYSEAYAKLAAPYRDTVPFERFREGVSRNAYLREMESLRVRRRELGPDAVRIHGEIRSRAGRVEVEFHLTKSTGDAGPRWGISGVVVAGSPALPPPL